MSAELVDERVVEMRFDNKDFEKNVDQSIKTINKLKDSLDFEESEKSFENISKAAAKCDMKPLEDSLESVSVKFNMLEMVAANVLGNIVNQAVNAGIKFTKSMSIDQITAGWSKYEQKTQSVQTIMAATGLSIDEVNSQLEKLIWFADETSYSFTDMVNNVGKFTSAGVDIETAVDSMMGISNWAALSGAGIQQASRAMYNLSQAMGMGYVGIQDWKSIELANMATIEFKQTIIDTAVELGTLKKAADGTITTMKGTEVVAENMRETLKEKWFTGEVLNTALNEYSSFANAVRERQEQWANEHNGAYLTVSRTIKLLQQEGYEMDSIGARAFQRAQEAITLTQAIAATTDAVSSGWMRTFEIIFGNYNQAKRLWTDLANDLWDIFASGSERRNDSLSNIFESNYQKMLNNMPNASEMNDRLYKKLFDMASINHGEKYAKALFSEYDSLEELLKNNADSIYSSTLEKAFFQVSEDLIKESQTAENLYKELTEGRLTLKQAAIRLAQGQYGTDVEAQKKAVEELGFEYEYLLDYADAWKTGIDLDWKAEQKALEEHLQEQTKYCKDFAKELKKIDPFSGFFEGLTEKGGRDKLIGGFQNILKTFKNVYLTIIEIKNGISDLTGTGSFLGTIIDGFYRLTEVFAYLDDEFEIVQENIYNFFHGGLQKMWTDFWSGGYVVKQGQQVWDHLTEQYVDLVEFVPGIFERVKNAYDNYLGRIPENISKSIENIRIKVFGFFGSIPEKFKNLTEQIFGKLESTSVVDVITGKTTQAYHITGGFLNNLKDSIRELGGGFGGKMIDGLATGLSRIGDIIFGYEKDGEKIQGIIVPIYDKVTALWRRLKDIGKTISDSFSGLKTQYPFIDSISNGLKSIYDSTPFKAIRKLFGGEEEDIAGSVVDPNRMKGSFKRGFSFTEAFNYGKENASNFLTKVKDKFEEIYKNAGYTSVKEFFFGNKQLGKDNLILRTINNVKDRFNELKAAHPWIQTVVDWIEKEIEKIKEIIKSANGSLTDGLKKVKDYFLGVKDSISDIFGSIFKKEKKSALEQMMDAITGPGKTMNKIFNTLRIFILSLSGLNIALMGLNFRGLGFEVKSPLAELVDIAKEFAIAVALIAGSFALVAVAIKKYDLSVGGVLAAVAILAVIMAALMACAIVLDQGTQTASLKDIIAQSVTTVPMLRTLAMVLAEIAAFAVVFTLLARFVGTKKVLAGAGAVAILLAGIGILVAALYLPDLINRNGKNKLKSKAGDLIGISLILMMLVPFLLTLGAVIAEMALIATLIPKNPETLVSFGALIVVIIGSITGILWALSKFSGKGVNLSVVASLAIISIIIGQIGLIIGSFAVLSKLIGKQNMWSSLGILEVVLITVFGFILGMNKLMGKGIDISVTLSLVAVVALIQAIGDVIQTIAKTIKDTGSDNTFSAFGIIIGSLVIVFLAIKGLSKVELSGDEIWNVIKMMGLMGLLALEVWGLIAIANRANITSYDALLPMLAAIGELAVTMIILGAVIGTIGRLGDKVLAALPQALAGIFAVSVGIVAIGSAFILINKAFTWLSDSIGGESISDSTDKIIEFLVSIMHGIGEMVGALIGGIGEGISDSLPTIGANISAFTEKLKPFFEFIAGLKEAHAAGAVIFTGVMVSIVADEILAIWQRLLSNFTGDMSSTGTNLSDFTDNLNRFFNNIVNLKEEHLSGAKVLTAVMAEIVKQDMILALENILTWFQGKVNFDTFVTNLNTIADGVVEMDGKLAGIDKSKADDDIAIIKSILDFLTDDSYKTGGIAGFVDILINGSTKFKDLFKKLNTDVVSGFKTFCTNVAYVNVDNAKKAAEILPVIMDMLINKEYRTGGISGFFDMITNGTTDFEGMFTTLNTKILPGLRDFASGLSAVDDTGNSLDYSGISNAAEAMKALMDLMSMDASNLITDKESKFLWWKVDDSDATKIGESFKVIEDAVVPAITGLQDALMGKDIDAEFMKGTVGVFQSLVQTLMDFSQLGLDETTVKNIGSYIITGLVTALDEGVDLVREAATRVANGIVEGLTLTLQIQSPSRVARDIGEFAYQGLIEGIEAGDDKAYKVAQMLGMEVARGLKDSIPKKIEAPELDTDPFLGHASDATEGMFAYLKYGLSADSFKNGGFDISYDNALEAAKKAGDDSAVKYLEAFEGKIKNVRLEKDSVTDMFKQFGVSGIEEFVKGDYASQIARNMVTNLGADIFGESAEFLDFDMDQVTEVLSGLGPFGELFAGAISDLTLATDKAKEATKSETKVNVDSSQVEEAVNWLDVLSEQYKVTDTQLTTRASLKLQKGEKLTEKEAMALQNVWDGVMLGMYGSGEKRIEELQKLGVDWYSLFALSDSRGGLDWSNSVNTALEYADTVIALGNDYKTSDLFKDISEGKWGEGADRLKALEKAGYDAEKVQKAFAKWYSDPSYDPGDYYGKVTDEEKELAEQTEKLNEVLNSTPEGAFRTVADFLEGVAKVIEKDEVSTKFKEFMTSVDESMSGVKLDNASDFEKVANFLNAIRTTAKESTGIATDFATFMENINGSLNTLNGLNSGEEDSDPIGDLVSKINGMPDLDTAKTQPLVDFLNSVTNSAQAISNSTLNATIMSLATAMITVFEGYYSSFVTVGQTIVLNIVAGMDSMRTAAMSEGGSIAGAIMAGFGDAFSNEENQNKLDTATSTLSDSLASIAPDGYAMATNMIDGIIQGIIDGAKDVNAALAWLAAGGQGEFQRTNKAASPAKKYIEFAHNMTDGLVIGLKEGSGSVFSQISETAGGAMDTFSSVISSISDDIESDFADGPVIRPVVDMSDVYNSASNIDAALSRDRAFSISAGEYNKAYQNGVDGQQSTDGRYVFNQYNYSPKPLSRLEIYRQTKNQFAMMQNT